MRTGLWGLSVTASLVWALLVAWPIPEPLAFTQGSVLSHGERTDAPALHALPSLASAVSRPLFQAGGRSTAATPAQAGMPSAEAGALASRFTVSGVLLGNPSQAVLEDAQTQKTYLVTTGQRLFDGAVVEEIQAGRVLLNRSGERIELIR